MPDKPSQEEIEEAGSAVIAAVTNWLEINARKNSVTTRPCARCEKPLEGGVDVMVHTGNTMTEMQIAIVHQHCADEINALADDPGAVFFTNEYRQ